jgi:hypothetical protein
MGMYNYCAVAGNKLICIFVINFIILVFSRFRTNLLAANHLIIRTRTKFDTGQKSSKFLLEIMTLVSSANNIISDITFILRGRSFICVMNNRGPRIDVSMYPSQRKTTDLY